MAVLVSQLWECLCLRDVALGLITETASSLPRERIAVLLSGLLLELVQHGYFLEMVGCSTYESGLGRNRTYWRCC
jgi:hypothetical protein